MVDIIVRSVLSLFPYWELSHFFTLNVWTVGTSCERLLLQFCTNRYGTLHAFSPWYEDVPVVWI